MNFGIGFFPSWTPDQTDAKTYFADCLAISKRADELGYRSVKTVEHYFQSYGGQSPNPMIFLAAVGTVTQRIRVMTGAVVPAFNHPLKLAGELAMLDAITGGRLDAGFARAFLPFEFDAFGVDLNESTQRFREGIEAVKLLWTSDGPIDYRGQIHRWKGVESFPKVTQKPHPPIYIAVTQTRTSFEWAGQEGYNIMIIPHAGDLSHTKENIQLYREAYARAGHRPGTEKIQISYFTYLAEDHHEAIEGFKTRMASHMEVFRKATASWVGRDTTQYPGYDKMLESMANRTPEDIIAGKSVFVGTPMEVAETVRHTVDLFGETEASLYVSFGGITRGEALRSVELFATHVMPRFGKVRATA